MKRLAIGLLVWSSASWPTGAPSWDCLPSGVASSGVVSRGLTVADRLADLDARCDGPTLVDRHGREIRFYRLTGCWGNPPADAQEILDNQRRELDELRRRYTVIEMTCSPDGDPRRIQ
jgi:hypothetical protein